MYEYLLGQWKMKKVDAIYIQARCPRWITQEQVDLILATPQDEIGTYSITPTTI